MRPNDAENEKDNLIRQKDIDVALMTATVGALRRHYFSEEEWCRFGEMVSKIHEDLYNRANGWLPPPETVHNLLMLKRFLVPLEEALHNTVGLGIGTIDSDEAI